MRRILSMPPMVKKWIEAVTDYTSVLAEFRQLALKKELPEECLVRDLPEKHRVRLVRSAAHLLELEDQGAGEATRIWMQRSQLFFLNWIPCSSRDLGIKQND